MDSSGLVDSCLSKDKKNSPVIMVSVRHEASLSMKKKRNSFKALASKILPLKATTSSTAILTRKRSSSFDGIKMANLSRSEELSTSAPTSSNTFNSSSDLSDPTLAKDSDNVIEGLNVSSRSRANTIHEIKIDSEKHSHNAKDDNCNNVSEIPHTDTPPKKKEVKKVAKKKKKKNQSPVEQLEVDTDQSSLLTKKKKRKCCFCCCCK